MTSPTRIGGDGAGRPSLAWQEQGLCATVPPDDDGDEFFPNLDDRAGRESAREFCGHCPVQQECLAYGIATRQQYGVWGGITASSKEWKLLGGSCFLPRRSRGTAGAA
ncbi:WhiB family transcriptional regulator [Streptomyces virginiae]|uniref:WhiB family transcriptional regulator n=1 Tax=Streptomyces virginiae TaxID=1961 RepID=UPI003448C782